LLVTPSEDVKRDSLDKTVTYKVIVGISETIEDVAQVSPFLPRDATQTMLSQDVRLSVCRPYVTRGYSIETTKMS